MFNFQPNENQSEENKKLMEKLQRMNQQPWHSYSDPKTLENIKEQQAVLAAFHKEQVERILAQGIKNAEEARKYPVGTTRPRPPN